MRGVLQPTGADETGKGKILTYTVYNKGFFMGKGEGNENNFVDHRHHFYCWAANPDRSI
ncbi:MAG: hypothetical protein QRY16_16710 [Enterobacterales bacterium endosymbiont of Blomia tropicalis]|uniref:hypothetical protein n=1 Tax=Mixta mediterraneensis TaxID=2758443 RepID=UPI0025A723F6|nr:hypothetical protein [Mixta mediterraneensis]MDL4915351.1 hypothetical protein [Mixta mediterraneensis]